MCVCVCVCVCVISLFSDTTNPPGSSCILPAPSINSLKGLGSFHWRTILGWPKSLFWFSITSHEKPKWTFWSITNRKQYLDTRCAHYWVHYYYLDLLLLTSLSWQCKEIYVNYSVTAICEYQKWKISEFMLMMGVRLFTVWSILHISKSLRLEWSIFNGLLNINIIYIISHSVMSDSLQPHGL